MNTEPVLSDQRLRQRQEHLMSEIHMLQHEERTGATMRPLAALGARQRRAWLAVPGGLAAAAAAGIITVTMLGGGGNPGAPAFAVETVSQNSITVKVVNTAVAADKMTSQLRERGLNITVESVPVSPQLVGTWVGSAFSGDVPEKVAQSIIKQTAGYVTTIELPARFEGQITLTTGHATESGAEPMISAIPNALAPGGRLGCLHATGTEPAELEAQAAKLGYTVTWADGDNPDVGNLPVPKPALGQRVLTATIPDTAPSTVQVVVADPDSRGYTERAGLGYSPIQWTATISAGPAVRRLHRPIHVAARSAPPPGFVRVAGAAVGVQDLLPGAGGDFPDRGAGAFVEVEPDAVMDPPTGCGVQGGDVFQQVLRGLTAPAPSQVISMSRRNRAGI